MTRWAPNMGAAMISGQDACRHAGAASTDCMYPARWCCAVCPQGRLVSARASDHWSLEAVAHQVDQLLGRLDVREEARPGSWPILAIEGQAALDHAADAPVEARDGQRLQLAARSH